ncbi:MAG TPA: SUMF1/EgtB/PvdO family nonheme iron enzyme [Pirellulaceae bacterium]|nr:SUMF1/EgtB/PvdO family nonheme iron enzyme [Pirellulaceae bacterium]
MLQKYPYLPLVILGLASAACLALGAWLGQWIIGLGGAAAGLCLMALVEPMRRHLGLGGNEEEKFVNVVELTPAPRRAPPPSRPLPEPAADCSDGTAVEQMLAQGRYALLLRPQIASTLSLADVRMAQEALDVWMGIVPQGPVMMRCQRYDELEEDDKDRVERRIEVDGFYLDRYCVTNRQYKRFLDSGGYEQLALWDEAIWPAMLQFVDQTGAPGPRFWHNGTYESSKEDHPVVGICWYEATAYARWVGKRLPSDPEWVKAASWPVVAENGKLLQRKFPWGDAMDRSIVNLWGCGPGDTIPVSCHPQSACLGGPYQLIGNVWEWTSTNFGVWEPSTLRLESEMPLKSLRGGAFDTYFDTQATSFFQSGDNPLVRRHNIGFRCAVGVCDIYSADELAADGEGGEASTKHEEAVL